MQTSLAEAIKNTAEGREADKILRKCVHCGFCTATCPTYRLLGDELDSPRGRIYLIKALLEGNPVSSATQIHVDRCLTCRACETTCPSGVEYGRLIDIGRQHLEKRQPRPPLDRMQRFLLRKIIPYPRRFASLLWLGRSLRPLLPARLKDSIPPIMGMAGSWPATRHPRVMLLLEGCVQTILAPNINTATARILDRLGISAIPAAGCCGAVSHHLSAEQEALRLMRHNIDAWWPRIAAGATTIISTASGCGALVKDYGYHLRNDQNYADKAATISGLTKDISEVLSGEDLSLLQPPKKFKIAFQSPCSLQHAQKLNGVTEALLEKLGFTLTFVRDSHLCCGSAGVYSILQNSLAKKMREEKITVLETNKPEFIATANIGCYSFIKQSARSKVRHWIELLDTTTLP
jgi:glycolate oxidase iron-sulfur subunit